MTGQVWLSVCHFESRHGPEGAETAPGIVEAVLKKSLIYCAYFIEEQKPLAEGHKQSSMGMQKAAVLKDIKLKIFLNDVVT